MAVQPDGEFLRTPSATWKEEKPMFSFDCELERLLDDYLRQNQDALRTELEHIAQQRIADVIGTENLRKVGLTFSGAELRDLKVRVHGPQYLQAEIEHALANGTS
jgi:hypothetical protein